ncbi:hypothetical protein WA556_002271 [Blastocystis sp. ATCC 50177/Nand II]
MQRVASLLIRSLPRSGVRAACMRGIPALHCSMPTLLSKSFATSANANQQCGGACKKNCSDCHKMTMCWNCHHFTDCHDRFCPTCHKIQPVYSVEEGGCNFFQLFGLPETYDIDPAKLEANFKNMQKVIHPDLFSSKSEEEKAVSTKVSTTINIAHNKLKNPISRAAYLVKLITGKDVLGEDDNYKVPMEVLMEVMEIREKLSDAKTDEEKDALKGKVKDSFKQHENAFRCGLCKRDNDSICNEAVAMKYYDSIIRELNGELG